MPVEMGVNHMELYPDTQYHGAIHGENSYLPRVDTPVENSKIDTKIVGRVNGRDIRATVVVNSDGTTVFDHQPPDVELHDAMYQKIEPGTHMLPGYEYPATVLPSKTGIFYISQDAVGNKQALAEVFLLGDHYQNGVGEKIPGDQAWTKRVKGYDNEGNPIFENETRAFISLSSTVYKPGRVNGHLLHRNDMKGEYQEAKKIYNRVTQDEVHMQRMKNLREQLEKYRSEKIQMLLEEPMQAVGD